MDNDKPSFLEICRRHRINYDILYAVMDAANIHRSVFAAMCNGLPVKPGDARAMLAIMSRLTEHDWTFDNMWVPLKGEEHV